MADPAYSSDDDVPSVEDLRAQDAAARRAKPNFVDAMTDRALQDYRRANKRDNRLFEAGIEDFGVSKGFLGHIKMWTGKYEQIMKRTYGDSARAMAFERLNDLEVGGIGTYVAISWLSMQHNKLLVDSTLASVQ